jgi:hypothetical protein
MAATAYRIFADAWVAGQYLRASITDPATFILPDGMDPHPSWEVLPVAWEAAGDGATTAFPLSGAVSTVAADYTVTVDGTPATAGTDYTVTGGVLRFTTAPADTLAIVVSLASASVVNYVQTSDNQVSAAPLAFRRVR